MEDLRAGLLGLLDEHRAMLHDSLDGLTEAEVRARLVPSATTLVGLVKHVTWVERFWYGHAITGRSLTSYGVPRSQDASFRFTDDDTIEAVQAAHREACDASRASCADLPLDHHVDFRGGRTLWSIHAHMLRELAQHCGHADILREQVLAARDA